VNKKKIKATCFSFIKSILFLFSTLFFHVHADTKITAKNGDTLLNLSKEYGISLKELMHKNNFNDANKILEGEVIIIPFKNSPEKHLTYKVKAGDTLYRIARDYNVNVIDIMSINNLKDDYYLKPNQIILLPKGAIYRKSITKKEILPISQKVFYHKTIRLENISDIAKIHNVSGEEIILLNKLDNPVKVDPDTKLRIRKDVKLNWKKYGSIVLNFSDWTYLDGNYVTEAKNKKNKFFYLSINCRRRVLNNTLLNTTWTNWYSPNLDFEYKLINDLCDQEDEI
tara:strand:- start:74 stop:922 length:849 start_codon:yes stop_codon:yes gene_type:complete